MADVAAVLILLVVLGLVVRPPRPWPEVAWAGPAALLVVAVGLEPWRAAVDRVRELGPTLAFLAGILVVGECARAAGLFDRARRPLDGAARRGPGALLSAVVGSTVAVTTVLSLDATAVLFTPVVARAVRDRPDRDRSLLATVLLANGASTLLPIANLTNLLVVQRVAISFPAFAARMALPTVVATLVIGATCWWRAGRTVDPTPTPADPPAVPAPTTGSAPLVVGAGLVVLLVGFVVASLAHVATAWVAVGGGLVGAAFVGRAGLTTGRRLARATSPAFLAFVAALAVVVDAGRRHGLGRLVTDRLPHGSGLGSLLVVALLAAVLANLVNNLPATLVLLPALAHRPSALLLAMLLGVNIGPNLTYTGSLATLLWRKVVRAEGVEPPTRTFLGTAWVATPLALAGSTVALWAGLRLWG